jgi:hypothetical protein
MFQKWCKVTYITSSSIVVDLGNVLTVITEWLFEVPCLWSLWFIILFAFIMRSTIIWRDLKFKLSTNKNQKMLCQLYHAECLIVDLTKVLVIISLYWLSLRCGCLVHVQCTNNNDVILYCPLNISRNSIYGVAFVARSIGRLCLYNIFDIFVMYTKNNFSPFCLYILHYRPDRFWNSILSAYIYGANRQ